VVATPRGGLVLGLDRGGKKEEKRAAWSREDYKMPLAWGGGDSRTGGQQQQQGCGRYYYKPDYSSNPTKDPNSWDSFSRCISNYPFWQEHYRGVCGRQNRARAGKGRWGG
jgi:hypothetical protein